MHVSSALNPVQRKSVTERRRRRSSQPPFLVEITPRITSIHLFPGLRPPSAKHTKAVVSLSDFPPLLRAAFVVLARDFKTQVREHIAGHKNSLLWWFVIREVSTTQPDRSSLCHINQHLSFSPARPLFSSSTERLRSTVCLHVISRISCL